MKELTAEAAEARAKAAEHFDAQARTSRPKSLRVATLFESPFNPRKKVGDVTALAASMKQMGLIQPITVRPAAAGLKGFEIVVGHRRAKAAESLGWQTIAAHIIEATDVQVMEHGLIENIERASLSPLEEAEGFAALRDAAGYTPEQLALKTGRTKGWVYQRIKLLDLCTEARKALHAGKLQLSVAIPLARLPNAKLQVKALERVAGDVPLSTREAIEYLQREFCISLKSAPFDRKDDMLVPEAGACVKCPKRSGSNVPGLFEDLESQDICTDVVCYQEKAKATWEEKAEKAAKQGAEVLGIAEGKKLFRDGTLQYGVGFVSIDQPVHADTKKRTWAEVLEKSKEPPRTVVAPDGELRPHRLYRADAAMAAAAAMGVPWAQGKAEPAAGAEKQPVKPEAPGEEQARAIRAKVSAEVLVGSALKMLSLHTPPPALYVLMAKAVEATRPASAAVTAYLERQRVKDFSAWVPKASEKELLGFVFVALTDEWCGGTWQGFDEGLEMMARAFGFDLQAMVTEASRNEK